MTKSTFPNRFVWGAATSSLQVEGAANKRGESIWDRFAKTPGNIEDGSNVDVACDHYNRWREDLDLLEWLGVAAYRFSVCWPRVIPLGRGVVNDAGLDFYDSLVDGLLEKDIRPWITLYHWELPQALQDQGGWGARQTVDAFVDYVGVVTSRLGDRVKHWVTHNEPWCTAHLGHESGEHAPGHKDAEESLQAAHHVLLSHGLATSVIRENSPNAQVGIVLNLTPSEPISLTEPDVDAARWFDGWFNRWYLDPIFHGRYPADAVEDRVRRGHLPSETLPFVEAGDMEAIASRIDFLGVNYYSRAVMQVGVNGEPEGVRVAPDDVYTEMGWEVYPQGLFSLLMRLKRDYGPKMIYITENGAAYGDSPDKDGRIRDTRRIEFLRNHICAVRRAIEEGAPVGGYFAWSLLDNFEWSYGYNKRFGLFWVDFNSQQRIAKESAYWYRDFIANGGREGGA
jgi:beta-glucosidase